MKKTLGTLFLLMILVVGYSQKSKNYQRALVPARGHYKQLEAFSPTSKSADEEIDKQKFITDKETIERRMSITPVYLTNLTVNDFVIPDVPTNSSEQTRAEINYLLVLQNARTDEEVRASKYMANIYYNLRVKPEDSTYTMYRRNLSYREFHRIMV